MFDKEILFRLIKHFTYSFFIFYIYIFFFVIFSADTEDLTLNFLLHRRFIDYLLRIQVAFQSKLFMALNLFT